MSRITGTLEIDFETGKTITQEQYDKFERTLNKMVEDWEMMVNDNISNNKITWIGKNQGHIRY